jgi:hypothetical protein
MKILHQKAIAALWKKKLFACAFMAKFTGIVYPPSWEKFLH